MKENQNKIQQVQKRGIGDEMRESYLDYAMSVIVSRALPDIRDGLKPVQRRILYTMRELGLRHSAKYVKSARIVGEVLGKYHPHGDSSVYDALSRMAQHFSQRYPLIQGQGNFGSIDGDSPAAMRYTEARMSKIAEELLLDIDKDTVDFTSTYDGSRKEPAVLPSRIPYLLLNGSFGIAVGMATNIPPHNLCELVNATLTIIDKPKVTLDELLTHIKGPDFPMGGLVFNNNDIAQAYATGRGGIVVRGETEIIEKTKKSYRIEISSIPYQVNKSELIEKIATLVNEKKIDGIRDVRDESDKEGLSIAIDLKHDAFPQKVLNSLYKHTDLEKMYHYNMLSLIDGIQPQTISLKTYLEEFVKAREIMVERRTRYELRLAEERAHILEGLKKALDHIDQIIKTIKTSPDRESAHKNLMKKFTFSDKQATAILEMKLQTLAGLERKKVQDELAQKQALIKELRAILKDRAKLMGIIKKELSEAKEKYGDERRTKIIPGAAKIISQEDMVPEEDQAVLMTRAGYLKRIKPQEFRAQKRGGKGITGGEWKDEDTAYEFTLAGTHDTLMFFSTSGKVYETKTYEIPETSRTAKGKPIVNFLALGTADSITSFLAIPKNKKDYQNASLVMVTKNGIIKKTDIRAFEGVRRSGIVAIKLQKKDVLAWAGLVGKGDHIMLFTKRGQTIRFKESDVRQMGRQATGVRAIHLKTGDEVVWCGITRKDNACPEVFVASEHGFGKKTDLSEFKVQSRGGSGIKVSNVSAKTGLIVVAKILSPDNEEFIAISKNGKALRAATKEIPKLKRATQGVRIMRLEQGDKLASAVLL